MELRWVTPAVGILTVLAAPVAVAWVVAGSGLDAGRAAGAGVVTIVALAVAGVLLALVIGSLAVVLPGSPHSRRVESPR